MNIHKPNAVRAAPGAANSLRAATRPSSVKSRMERWGMRLLIFGLFCLCLKFNYLLFFAPGKGFDEAHQMNAAVIEQKEKNQRLANRNTSLKAEIAALKQGLTAVEEHARFKLGMISEDETFFAILNTPIAD